MIDKIKLNKNIQILVRIQALNRVSLFFFLKDQQMALPVGWTKTESKKIVQVRFDKWVWLNEHIQC